jgi:hypothetical protein
MKDGTPSADDNLLGMEIDFVALLSGLDELDADSVSVHRTEHAERLIRATSRAAPGVPLRRAGEAVRSVWLSSLRYAHLGPYVTGRARIAPASR